MANQPSNPSEFNRTPLSELTNETKLQLSCMLSRKKVLRTEDGYERDWRGIAHLAKLTNLITENVSKPMDAVLSTWIQHNPNTAEVGYLEQYLGIIDRWDVQDDIKEYLIKDTERFNMKKQQREQLQNNNSVTQSVNIRNQPRYNACILYAEADVKHAMKIVDKLENPPYNMKLFMKHRDIPPEVPFEYDNFVELMANRCNHLIVLLTEKFVASRENANLMNFMEKLQIERSSRRIIPILYNSNIELPKILCLYTCLEYRRSPLFSFWDRLASSIEMNISQIYYSDDNRISR